MSTPFEAGHRIGPYELLRLVARGGMAEIWLARAGGTEGISKTVVVKRVLAARADDGRFRRMFVGEARVAMGLDHGNIAQVFDFFEADGEYFLVMEYVDGPSLYELIRLCRKRGLRFPWPHAAHVVREVARGLHHAHTRTGEDGLPLNVVHRDVSPQNVLVSFDGQVKLVDFGIARARTVASETRAGVAKGKYVYFSPEQARGHPLDHRTDVYACGVVLYELVTGRLPVGLDLPYAEALARIVHGGWPPPREVTPELPASLEAVILDAMAGDPDARHPTAHDLEVALGAWLHSEAPRVGTGDVAGLARWLCSDRLAEEGREPEPSDTLERSLASWRTDPAAATASGTRRPLGAKGALMAAGAGGIAVLVAAVVLLSALSREAPVPPPAPTPFEPAPAADAAPADRSDSAVEEAAPPAPPPRRPRTVPNQFRPAGEALLEARLPLEGITVPVSAVPATVVALDPLSHYTATVSGQGTLAGFIERHFHRIFFHASGPDGERSGVLGPDAPIRLQGKSEVAFFAWDSGDATGNRGSFTVEVRAGPRVHARVTLDPERDVVSGTALRLPRLVGLDPYRRYDATLDPEDGTEAGQILFMHTYEVGPLIAAGRVVDLAMGVLEAGETVEIHAANDVVVFRLATDPGGVEGTVRLVLRDRREADR